eukprot:9980801-Alexandrium_andersonii.AAC.1
MCIRDSVRTVRRTRTFSRNCPMTRGKAFWATSSGMDQSSGADITRVCAAALRGLFAGCKRLWSSGR